jgi:predicted transcriptional regulator
MKDGRFQFPQILKEAIKGLDNESRWEIVEYLIKNGETSYSVLLKSLKINNKSKLTFHLTTLSKSAIIERYEILGNKTNEESFYDISSFGKNVINGLMSALKV